MHYGLAEVVSHEKLLSALDLDSPPVAGFTCLSTKLDAKEGMCYISRFWCERARRAHG